MGCFLSCTRPVYLKIKCLLITCLLITWMLACITWNFSFYNKSLNCHESNDFTEALRLFKNEMNGTVPVFGM